MNLLALIVFTVSSSAFANVDPYENPNAPNLIGKEISIEVLPDDFEFTLEQIVGLQENGFVKVPAIAFAENDNKGAGPVAEQPKAVKIFNLLKAKVVSVENEASEAVHKIALTSRHSFSGMASYYGGKRSKYSGFTAAHRSLPFGTRVRVTHGEQSVIVTINDRGPFIHGRVIDIDTGAARAIGLTGVGVGRVVCEVL